MSRSIKEILAELENSVEIKDEAKRQLTEISKGPENFDHMEMMTLILSLRMAGVKPEQIMAMSFLMINKLMRICGISDDEMMEHIRRFK